jgi:hypothetical protein
MRRFLSIGRDIDFRQSMGKGGKEDDSDDDNNRNEELVDKKDTDNSNATVMMNRADSHSNKGAVSLIKKLDKRVLLLEEQQIASEERIMQHVQEVVNGMEARIVSLCAELANSNKMNEGSGGGDGGKGSKSADNTTGSLLARRGVPPPPAPLIQAQPQLRLRGTFFDCNF